MGRGALAGPSNHNWRGGRSIASNGYVLVRVGVDHHLADVRGYAYEHRLVAEKKLGRRLRPGEIPHHVNGVKTDNRPENILVVASTAEHAARHRKTDRLRAPGAPNPTVECACGCGRTFLRFDAAGRPRKFLPHHSDRGAPKRDAIKAAVLGGASTIPEIMRVTGCTRDMVRVTLSVLVATRALERRQQGVYGPIGSGPLKPQRVASCACGCGTRFPLYDASGRSRRFVSGHNFRRGASR